MSKIINIPNAVTLFRLLLIIPIVLLLIYEMTIPAAILFFVFCVLDMLDGYLAKSLGLQTRFGDKFDKLTDMIFGAAIFFTQVLSGRVPTHIWILAALALIMTGVFTIDSFKKKGRYQVSRKKEFGAFVTFGFVFMLLLNTYNIFTLIIIYLFIAGLHYIWLDYFISYRISGNKK